MKILIISSAFPPMAAGEATNTYFLSQHLANHDFEVHVLTSQGNTANPDPRIKVHPIMKNWSWSEAPRLIKFLKRCSPDAILLMYLGWIYKYHPMITFAPTLSKRVLPCVPFVTRFESIGGSYPQRMPKVERLIRKAAASWACKDKLDYNYGSLLRDSDRIILLSEYHRVILSKHLQETSSKSVLIPPPPNIRVSPDNEGIGRKKGRKKLGVEDQHFLICYIGYIYPGKGLETLFNTLQLVSDDSPHVRLALIGGSIAPGALSPSHSSYVTEMAGLIKHLGITENVVWTGEFKWDTDEVCDYLRAADVCVLPFDEGAHLNNSSLASAASLGLPIITTEPQIVDKPFIHKQNVFFCPPKNPEALATAIKTLMDNNDLRESLSLGALQLSHEWFSWEKAIDRTVATLFA